MGKADIKSEESKDKVRLKSRRKDVLPTKIVIRRLPPTLTEEQLKEEWAPLPDHDYFRFEGPDYSLGPVAFSRVYLNLKNFNDMFSFQSKYDGYIFVDARGVEYSAVVEPAPYQKVPKLVKKRKDVKCATIEKDPDYISFVESLGKEEEAVTSYQETLQQMEAAKADPKANKITTPLIEFLKAKHAARISARAHANNEKRGGKDGRDTDKESSKSGKKDARSSTGESRNSASDKKGNEKKGKENTRKDDVKDKKGSPSKEKQLKDSKEGNKESKGKLSQRKSKEKMIDHDRSNRSASGRGDQQKRKDKDRERDQDERSRDYKSEKKGNRSTESKERDSLSPQKSSKGGQSRSDDSKSHKGSIKYDDPIIVAFCKSGEGKETEEKVAQEKRERDHGDERGPNGRVRNKDRPAREIYRPPVRPASATSRGKDSKTSPEKVAHSDRDQSYSDKGSSKDRYKYSASKDKDKDRSKERDARSRDTDRDRDRDRDRDKECDRDRDRNRYRGRYSDRDREKGRERDKDRDWEPERDRTRRHDDDRDYSQRDGGKRRDDRDRDYGREKTRDRTEKHKDTEYTGNREREKGP